MKRERKKYEKALIFVVIFAMLAFVNVECTSAATISVPDDYATIQCAVDNTTAGDTIVVKSGTYYENVNVNKQLTLRGVDTGDGKPVVDAGRSGSAITLSADGITLEGFTITNSGSLWRDAGIRVISNNNTISGNTVSSNNGKGIYLYRSSNNTISGNTASSNNGEGIYLYFFCNNNTITGNTASSNDYHGISLDSSCNNTISDNNISNSKNGISIWTSRNNVVIGNNVSNNKYYGIRLCNSRSNTISGNTGSNNRDGIILHGYSTINTISGNNFSNNYKGICLYLNYCNSNTITGNNVSNNNHGISLQTSSDNTIIGNNFSDNNYGIYFSSSNKNTIKSNTFLNDGLFVHDTYQNIVENNTVNGKPLVYLEDTSDIAITDAGQIILVKCSNITVENLYLANTCLGIELWETEKSRISNCTISNNYCGISLFSSYNNSLKSNTFINDGLSVYNSYQNSVENNTVNGKSLVYLEDASDIAIADAGQIILVKCSNITVENLNLSNTCVGIGLCETENSRISNNTACDNMDGIYLETSGNNNISGNNVSNNKRVGIYLNSSDNNNIKCNSASNNKGVGIVLDSASNNNISGNNVSNNKEVGIVFVFASNNTITGNNVSNDNCSFDKSSSNKVYLNNFKNIYNFYSDTSANIWNSTSKITYTYKGKTYTNYLGNYWGEYKGKDTNGDGIGYAPHSMVSAFLRDIPPEFTQSLPKDNYPLMAPFETYFALVENIFDTGASKNPHPSISGMHNGIIKPSRDITVSMLYTYPCSGTGGHTEYVRIGNESGIIAEAHWTDYKGNWHNITFPEAFILEAGKTYNYTIQTGSYPQIHHNTTLTVPDGEITCTKFTDANGGGYYDRIPAIRLAPKT